MKQYPKLDFKLLTITYFIILFMSTSSSIFSQIRRDSLLNERILRIEIQLQKSDDSIKTLNKRIESLQNFTDKTFNSLSIQMSGSSYSLTIFGFLFAVIAIFLGLYISNIKDNIEKISGENKDMLAKNKEIKRYVRDIDKYIKGNINGLYLKIKREEISNILKRLVNIPEDINNVAPSLFIADLTDGDFYILKRAYENLNPVTREFMGTYATIFFQHFFGQTMIDEKLKNAVMSWILNCIDDSFPNDIIKSSKDFVKVINDKGVLHFKDDINSYFIGISSSKHKDFNNLYKIIFDNLKSKNRIDFFNAIELSSSVMYSKVYFGNLILEEFGSENQSEVAQKIANDIKLLKSMQPQPQP